MSAQLPRIDLKMSQPLKLMYAVVVFFSFWMALGAFAGLFIEKDPKELVMLFVGLVFFGGGSVFIVHLLRKDAGYIEIRPEGVFLDTQITSGLIRWENLAKVGPTSWLGQKFLGLKLHDVDAYLATRDSLGELRWSREREITTHALNFMLVARKIVPFFDMIVPVFGLSKFPDSADERSMCASNEKNFGHHLLIQWLWVRDIPGAVRLIEKHRPLHAAPATARAKPTPADEPSPVTHAQWIAAGVRKCEMCAEEIRAEATVCRFCGYSKATGGFVYHAPPGGAQKAG